MLPPPRLVECHKLRQAALGHSQVGNTGASEARTPWRPGPWSSPPQIPVFPVPMFFSSAGAEGAEDLGFKF